MAGIEHRGTRAVQRMLEFAPAGGALALWIAHANADEDDDDPAPAWTDGRTIVYGPRFERLSLPLQTGWVAHEVLHVALRHAQRAQAWRARTGALDERLWNLCADAVVNSALAHLDWLELPRDAVTLESLLDRVLGERGEPEAALAQWDVERLYAALDDDALGGRTGRRKAHARALAAGSGDLRGRPDPAEPPEAEAEAARAWRERLTRAHAGDGAFSLLRTLLADLPTVRTPWEQVLRTQAAHALSRRPGLSWSRPTRSWLANRGRGAGGRRLPWEPGRTTRSEAPRVALVVDVSGSIDEQLLQRFGTELDALARRLESEIVLVVGDDTVRAVHRLRPGRDALREVLARPLPGGGGTDFTPLLEEAERHAPDLVLVLTDLEGPALHRPRAPVLWAVPQAHRHAVPPFGRLLVLD